MAKSYLDKAGLTYFWQKVKNYIDTHSGTSAETVSGKVILDIQTVSVQSSAGIAKGTSTNVTGSFTAVSGADGYFVIPIRTFQYNIVSGTPSVSGTTFTLGLYNISDGTHTVGVTCLVLAYKDADILVSSS